MTIDLWSTTAATNASADPGINFAENQAASTVNDSARKLMARVAEWLKDFGGTATTGGTGNAQTLTANRAFAAYADGLAVGFTAGNANTAAATLNVNAIGAKSIYANGAVLTGGEIAAGGVYICVYDPALNAAAGGWHLINPKTTSSTIANVPAGNISATTIQAAINELDTEKQPLDATLTALAGVTTAADTFIYATGADTFTTATFSSFGRTIVDDADAAAVRTTIGAQASGATLSSLEGLTLNAGDVLYATAADTLADLAIGTAGRYLRVNTGATAPEWTGGDLVHVLTFTPDAAAATYQTFDWTTYSHAYFEIDGVRFNGTSAIGYGFSAARAGSLITNANAVGLISAITGAGTPASADRWYGHGWITEFQTLTGDSKYTYQGTGWFSGYDASGSAYFGTVDGDISVGGQANRATQIAIFCNSDTLLAAGEVRVYGRKRSYIIT